VVIVAYEVPPCGGSVQRVTKFIKFLPAFGWEPFVLSTRVENYGLMDPSLVGEIREAEITRAGWIRLGRRFRGIASRSFASNSTGGDVTERWVRRLYQRLQAWNQLPDWAVGWIAPAVVRGVRLVRTTNAAVIYSVSPPYSAHLVGLIVSTVTDRPWVADFRDQWIEDSELNLPTRFHRKVHARLESLTIHRADHVVTTTRLMTTDLLERYRDVSPERIHTIMNGYDSEELPRSVAINREGFLAVHAGTFYSERTPEPLFRAFLTLRARGETLSRQLRVQLYGPKDGRTLSLISRFGLGDVVQHCGYVPHADVLRRLAAANLLLLVVHSNNIGRVAIPAKVFEYLALRRPLLALAPLDSEVAELIRQSGLGVVVAPDNVEGIADAMKRLYEERVGGTIVRGSEAFLRQFERSELTRQLGMLFDEAVEACSHRTSDRFRE
jgi:glycosyltransferase involved in cell wall biosynthesis